MSLDHGAVVPLWFLVQEGWRGPTVVVSLPMQSDHAALVKLGEALAEVAAGERHRVAIVASGDMSHRLLPDAPAGYDPDAQRFDDAVSGAVAAGEYRRVAAVDAELRELAAEDVVESLEIAAAAIGWNAQGHKLLSYEGPFGVGYLVAVLHDERTAKLPDDAPRYVDEATGRRLLALAREALATVLSRKRYEVDVAAPTVPSHGVFVTLYGEESELGHELRGCVGHIEPVESSLEREVVECAIASATRDTRMDSVRLDELPRITIKISILGPLEEVTDRRLLDEKRWGVVVSQGPYRGVLLPDVEGVDSVEEQLDIAARKGRVDRSRPHVIQRFAAQVVSEGRPGGP